MKVKIKTREQLFKEGFRHSKDGYYLGECKTKPSMLVTHYQSLYVVGKEFEVNRVEFNNDNTPRYKTVCGYTIPWFLIDGQLPDKSKLKTLTQSKTFSKGEVSICLLTGTIEFDCSMRKMNLKEVKQVYDWILKSKIGK